MKITDFTPHEVIDVRRYESGLDEVLTRDTGTNYLANFIEKASGIAIPTRLVVNRYGDHEDDFAGDYLLDVEDFTKPKSRRKMQPGMMMVRLALSDSAPTEGKRAKSANYYVTPRGILLPTSHLKWMLFGQEEGYFPAHPDEVDTEQPESQAYMMAGPMAKTA